MKKLDVLHDSIAKRDYELYSMSYQELKALVVRDLTMKEEDVIRYDSDSEYFRPTYSGKRKKEEKSTIRVQHAMLGLEQMPFILAHQTAEKRYVLMDGFNRLFGSFGEFEQMVLVKVYKDVTEKDWVNIMTHSNAWKMKQGDGVKMMDRGFKLSIFENYGIDLIATHLDDDRENPLHFQTIFQKYFNYSPFETLFDNDQFLNDTRLLIRLLKEPLRFHNKTKKVDEWIESAPKEYKRFAHSDELIKLEIAICLGHVRRLENKKGGARGSVTFEDVMNWFQQESLQKHFVKVTKMQVPGHTKNYIDKHLRGDLIDFLMGLMDVNDEPKEEEVIPKKDWTITEDML